MDVDVKNVLAEIHERAFQKRSSMQATRASKLNASTSSTNQPSKANVSATKQKEQVQIKGEGQDIMYSLNFVHNQSRRKMYRVILHLTQSNVDLLLSNVETTSSQYNVKCEGHFIEGLLPI